MLFILFSAFSLLRPIVHIITVNLYLDTHLKFKLYLLETTYIVTSSLYLCFYAFYDSEYNKKIKQLHGDASKEKRSVMSHITCLRSVRKILIATY